MNVSRYLSFLVHSYDFRTRAWFTITIRLEVASISICAHKRKYRTRKANYSLFYLSFFFLRNFYYTFLRCVTREHEGSFRLSNISSFEFGRGNHANFFFLANIPLCLNNIKNDTFCLDFVFCLTFCDEWNWNCFAFVEVFALIWRQLM